MSEVEPSVKTTLRRGRRLFLPTDESFFFFVSPEKKEKRCRAISSLDLSVTRREKMMEEEVGRKEPEAFGGAERDGR